ncbi:acyl carrier protein [Streptomyces geranii]|uniref:acyl carrier protein n=1 Tax=Streptomyces geranii TaxID=2058923 RepID=UPI000D04230A|nr:acyl carrier protein [Streptomyces geranii]
MITTAVTYDELADLIKRGAGVSVDPRELERASDTPFGILGLDSLGMLGIVGELENQYGTSLPPDTERCRTPQEFLDLVNSTLKAGA